MSERASEPRALQAVPGPLRDGVFLTIYAILLFFAMTVQTGQASVVIPLIVLVLSLGRAPLARLRDRLGLPLLGFLGFALMNGFAAIYAPIGSYAVAEFNKFIVSFSLAALLLARCDRRHVRGLLWGLAAVCAVLALVCVDMGCWTKIFEAFNSLMTRLGMDFSGNLEKIDKWRLNGLYSDANITGGLLGPVVFVCMYLLRSSGKRWQKALACLLLGVNSVGFLTAMSRGAIGVFTVTALVYLAVERKDRLGLFLLMVNTAVCMLGFGGAALLYMGDGSVVPDLLCFVCGGVLFLLDWLVFSRLERLLEGKAKLLTAVFGAVVLVAVVFIVAALNLTGAYTFQSAGSFYRSIRLPQGDYQVSSEWEGPEVPQVNIYCVDRRQALMKETTPLYEGPLDQAAFTLPEDGLRVVFSITGKAGVTLHSLEPAEDVSIPLKYKLLPEMISQRLHDGLFEGYSFLMRTQYYKDGWKLFLRSPVYGFGLGSTEGWLTSLQPFYYESLYLHNHILQVMCDMGLAGLVFWVVFLGGVLWLLVRRLRVERDSLAAVLLACWVMMFFHGLFEIDFSIRCFQCEAWLLLLLPVILYTKPLSSEKQARILSAAVALFMWVYMGVFAGLLESRRMANREMETFVPSGVTEFMETTERCIKMNLFDPEQAQLNYVGNAVLLDGTKYNYRMRLCVEALRASGTYTACSGLAEYYYLPRGEYEEMFACSRDGLAQEASVSDAWNQEFDFYRQKVLPQMDADSIDIFIYGIRTLKADLDTFSQGRMEEIVLTAENENFLRQIQELSDKEIRGESALVFLTVFGNTEMVFD